MRTFLLTVLVVLVALLLGVAGLVFTESGQGWAIRRALAYVDLGETKVEFQQVKVGLGGLRLRGLRVVHEGAVLDLPELDLAAEKLTELRAGKVTITGLVAHGWTLDLRGLEREELRQWLMVKRESPAGLRSSLPRPFSLLPTAYAQTANADAEPALRSVFEGVLSQIELPVDLSLDGVDLEGRVLFPKSLYEELPEAELALGLKGGGFGEGREGRFALRAQIQFGDEPGSVAPPSGGAYYATLAADLTATMESARHFSSLALELSGEGGGGPISGPLRLGVTASARRAAGGEDYEVSLSFSEKRWAQVQGHYSAAKAGDAGGLVSRWELALSEADLPRGLFEDGPLGAVPLPAAFELQGQGSFDLDAVFATLTAAGRLQASLEGLAALVPSVPAALDALSVDAEFGGTVSALGAADGATQEHVESLRLKVAVPGDAEPLLLVEAAQPFALNRATAAAQGDDGDAPAALRFVANDPQAALARVEIPGLPLALLEPFTDGVQFGASVLRGRFEASLPSESRVRVKTLAPLRVENLALTLESGPALENLSLETELELEHDFQTSRASLHVGGLTLRDALTQLLSVQLEASAEGLNAAQPSVSATGTVRADVGGLHTQPIFHGKLPLETGNLGLDFTAAVADEAQSLSALIELGELHARGIALPSLEAQLNAQRDEAGTITFALPLTVRSATRQQRVSDLKLEGTARVRPSTTGGLASGASGTAPADSAGGEIAAKIHGEKLYLDDFQFLIALASNSDSDETPTTPFMDNWSGEVGVDLDSVSYLGQLELRQVGATLKIGDGKLRFEGLKIGARSSTAGFLRGLQDNLSEALGGGLLDSLRGGGSSSSENPAAPNAGGDGATQEEAAAPALPKNPLDAISEGLRRLRGRSR
ncbi:hypothetical protein AXK11_03095 [Cephaloticoccus primus]|uniref:AsmA-like C-terminal domain-containing protein n=1 Tax=Cephaloticoccus primus TaxID=1548207 RepID=A0A139SQS7_9BACT|nr:hypothetical protein [Cephaloticoccus primus]KXU36965.1 hypothetical protein AXK11_03095 [Cephaloticoccus primus]